MRRKQKREEKSKNKVSKSPEEWGRQQPESNIETHLKWGQWPFIFLLLKLHHAEPWFCCGPVVKVLLLLLLLLTPPPLPPPLPLLFLLLQDSPT